VKVPHFRPWKERKMQENHIYWIWMNLVKLYFKGQSVISVSWGNVLTVIALRCIDFKGGNSSILY